MGKTAPAYECIKDLSNKIMNINAVRSEEDEIIVAKKELSKTGQQGELEGWKFSLF